MKTHSLILFALLSCKGGTTINHYTSNPPNLVGDTPLKDTSAEDRAHPRCLPETPPEISADNLITLEEIAALPEGTPALVRTVISGIEPVDLCARYLGLAADPFTGSRNAPYLMLETDEEDTRWISWGGAAAGMSGSPIVIDGKLAGALSVSVGTRREAPIPFMATPIERMLDVEVATEDATMSTDEPVKETSVALTIAGVGARFIEDTLGQSDPNLVPVYGLRALGGEGGGTAEGTMDAFVPGSAIAVKLLDGDSVSVFAIGTVTAVSGNALWAFGHPMTRAGEVDFPCSGATIFGINSDPFSGAYKVGFALPENLGRITADRSAAITGITEQEADTIGLTTRVTLPDGQTEETHHQIARVPLVAFPPQDILLGWGMVIPLDTLRDRNGPGSAEWSIAIAFQETNEIAEYSGFISAPIDLAGEMFWGSALPAVGYFSGANGIISTPRWVEFSIVASDERRELQIQDVDVAETTFAPGSIIPVVVTVKPYDAPPEERTFEIAIPEDFLPGSAMVDVGPEFPRPPTFDEDGDAIIVDSLDSLIEQFEAQPHSNVLEVRLTSQAGPPCIEVSEPCDCPPCDCLPCEGDECEPCTCETCTCTTCEETPPSWLPPYVNVTSTESGAVLGYASVSVEIE